MTFKIITINSIKEFQECKFNEYWLFRGQTQDWSLKSSIERLLDELDYDYYWYLDERASGNKPLREEFIDKFKTETGFINYKKLHLISLMQHYGLKTELLDVTENLDVGLFFACDNDFEQDGVLWAFNILNLYFCNIANEIVKQSNKNKDGEIAIEYSRKSLMPNAYFTNFVCHCSLYDFQKKENLRVKRQAGKFLFAPNFWRSNYFANTENAIFSSYGLSKNKSYPSDIKDIDYSSVGDKIIKFIIPAKLKRECLYYLRNKNITKEYLFPKTKEDYKLEKICSNILCEFRARESRLF